MQRNLIASSSLFAVAAFSAPNDAGSAPVTVGPTKAANAPSAKPEAAPAQPVPSAATVAAITDKQAADRKALAVKLAAQRKAAAPVVVTGKRGKAAPVTAKPKAKQAAKPVSAAEAKARDARNAAHNADRDTARRFYAGASLAAHAKRPCAVDVYASRVLQPIQRPADGNPSMRDDSGLALILSRAGTGGTFDPVALCFDAGILSRLAACKLVTYEARTNTFALTQAGLSRARSIVRPKQAKAAKAA